MAAALLLVLPVGVGVGSAPAHAVEVIDPDGGCWAYVPDRSAEDVLSGPALSDISTELLGWGGADRPARISLETSGATVVRENRGFRLELLDGPVLNEDGLLPVAGTATATFEVTPTERGSDREEPVLQRFEQYFSAPAGESVTGLDATDEGLVFEGSFATPSTEGRHAVELQSIHFDVDGLPGQTDTMVVCNGQEEGAVMGVNPVNTPLPIGVTEHFTTVSSRAVVVADVVGQKVTTAARAGDRIDLRVAGVDSEGEYTAQICAPQCATDADPLKAGVDGVGTTSLTIPADVPAGPATIQVASGAQSFPVHALTILGAPAVAATEVPGEGRLDVTVMGTGFDPGATVILEGVAGRATTGDATVEVEVGPEGSFQAAFGATDGDTTSLRLVQKREGGLDALVVTYDLEGAVPAPVDPPDEDPRGDETKTDDTESPSEVPTGTTTAPGTTTSTTPSALAPVEIPLPGDRPVDVVDAPAAPVADPAPALKVSEAHLAGEATLAEMFGGSSKRVVTFLAENVGESVIVDPLVALGVGRSSDVEPVIAAANVGDLQPGARVAVDVDVALPMASFGVYQVVGQVGDSDDARFTLEWETYPWGLIALNLLGIALLAWGLWRRRQRRLNPTPLLAGSDGEEAGASVVDLTALDEWWKTGKVTSRVLTTEDENDSVVDLDAADRWWAKRGKVS